MGDDEPRVAHLHGREVAYREWPGGGAPVLLVHGMGSSQQSWGEVPHRLAAAGRHVIAVDLPGHGDSSKERGDYSLGSLASALRDLLDHLGVERVHIVGHSLGGGVAMQFNYLFPERVESVVLESSGGLGEEVFPVLRAATLPGADLAIRVAINPRTMGAAAWLGRTLGTVGIRPHALSPGALETAGWLAEEDRRSAFLATVRSVLSPRGQRVSAVDKLHLLDGKPVLIVWGDRDPMIPMDHGVRAHELMPMSTLVIFPRARHEPHLDDPARFTEVLLTHVRGAESGDAG